MEQQNASAPQPAKKISVSLDYRIIIFVLLAIIAGMVIVWKPWVKATTDSRTVKVTGTAIVKAEPDEFVFYPSYEFKNANKDAALAELTKKSDEIVSKLKGLGLSDRNIKTNTDGYDKYNYYPSEDKSPTYALRLTVTVSTKDQAQKVQDYLITTTPQGSVSPQATFSTTKRKELESKARDQATKDARSKAEQSAKNLGFKVGSVKAVEDGYGFGDGGPIPLDARIESGATESVSKLAVQSGENDINYTVNVTYFVR